MIFLKKDMMFEANEWSRRETIQVKFTRTEADTIQDLGSEQVVRKLDE